MTLVIINQEPLQSEEGCTRSDWQTEVRSFTQVTQTNQIPSALLTMGQPGKCPKVFFVRINQEARLMTVVKDWQEYQWLFWNNLPPWVPLKTNQRRTDWR